MLETGSVSLAAIGGEPGGGSGVRAVDGTEALWLIVRCAVLVEWRGSEYAEMASVEGRYIKGFLRGAKLTGGRGCGRVWNLMGLDLESSPRLGTVSAAKSAAAVCVCVRTRLELQSLFACRRSFGWTVLLSCMLCF